MRFHIFQNSDVIYQTKLIVSEKLQLLSPFSKGENYSFEGRVSDLLKFTHQDNNILFIQSFYFSVLESFLKNQNRTSLSVLKNMSLSTPFLEKCAAISLESMSEESLRESQRTAQKILTANKSVDVSRQDIYHLTLSKPHWSLAFLKAI